MIFAGFRRAMRDMTIGLLSRCHVGLMESNRKLGFYSRTNRIVEVLCHISSSAAYMLHTLVVLSQRMMGLLGSAYQRF